MADNKSVCPKQGTDCDGKGCGEEKKLEEPPLEEYQRPACVKLLPPPAKQASGGAEDAAPPATWSNLTAWGLGFFLFFLTLKQRKPLIMDLETLKQESLNVCV